MEQIVQLFKALGDETRLKILLILTMRQICAKGLSKHLGISEAAVSQHLKILKDACIIVGEKRGYYVHYKIQKSILSELIKFIEAVNKEQLDDTNYFGIDAMFNCSVECRANKTKCCEKNINN